MLMKDVREEKETTHLLEREREGLWVRNIGGEREIKPIEWEDVEAKGKIASSIHLPHNFIFDLP